MFTNSIKANQSVLLGVHVTHKPSLVRISTLWIGWFFGDESRLELPFIAWRRVFVIALYMDEKLVTLILILNLSFSHNLCTMNNLNAHMPCLFTFWVPFFIHPFKGTTPLTSPLLHAPIPTTKRNSFFLLLSLIRGVTSTYYNPRQT